MVNTRCFLSIILVIINSLCIFSQTSLEDLDIIFKQDFNSNSPGRYNSDEWTQDFLNPPWVNRLDYLQIVEDPKNEVNPTKSLYLDFPANSLGPSEGGTHWPTYLPEKYDEIYVSYDIMFMPGFEFQRGGKIPGVAGGSISSNLDKPTGYDGFIAYLMFKGNRPVFYIYYPDANIPQYGATWGWGETYSSSDFSPSQTQFDYASGSVSFETGVWHNLTYRVVLNTVKPSGGGNYDGILEAWFDGKLVMEISHILFRHTTDLKIEKLTMQAFFGGGDDSWRNPIWEWIKLDNIMLYTFKERMDIPRGNTLSPTNRIINYWRKLTEISEDNPSIISNHSPNIQDQQFILRPNDFKDRYVGKVLAYDIDESQNLSYIIVSGNETGLFNIDSQTGDLKTVKSNVFVSGTVNYNLKIKVTDDGSDKMSNSATISVCFLNQSEMVYINPEIQEDPLEDGSISHPFNSWGDVKWKDGTTYLQKRGTIANIDRIVIGTNNVILDAYGEGDLPLLKSNTNSYMISAFEKSNISLKNLHLVTESAISCVYFLGSSSNNITVENCIIDGFNNAIRIVGGLFFHIRYNLIRSQNEGVYSTAAFTDVYYNIFKGIDIAVNMSSTLTKANVFNNVFVDNQESVSSSAAEITLYNNIFYFLNEGQKAVQSTSAKLASDHNIYYPEQERFVEISNTNYSNLDQIQHDMRIDIHSFTSDPQFMDVFNENYILKKSSPAINAGLNLNLEKDYYGNEVPNSGFPDIGICEISKDINNQEVFNNSGLSLMVYPNPSAQNISVKLNYSDALTIPENLPGEVKPSISILDLSGKTVFSKLIENTQDYIIEDIDISHVANGLYAVVLNILGQSITEKLIVSHL
jgi:hypothetical protein